MSSDLDDLTRIFDSRGTDGLSRADKERMANYKRRDFLFNKFLNYKQTNMKQQLTHEHILDIGEKTFNKFKCDYKSEVSEDDGAKLAKEIERIEKDAEKFQIELRKFYQIKFDAEKKEMKNSYEALIGRIEKQRDEVELERVKDIVRKMNEECEEALRRQWLDAEEMKKRAIDELRDTIRKEIHTELEEAIQLNIQNVLDKAEEEFKKREVISIQRTKNECEIETNDKIQQVCERYDASIDKLLIKLNENEEKLNKETNKRIKLENDFRLLQTDYKRFMNYTNHYHSDYMMKLRHIGTQLIEDKEFEEVLDEKIQLVDLKTFSKNKKL